ncbi:polysaccharide pyruvyl transferase family protein [Aequorivita sediminis]|uniref:polysaccharide pyruvyl transferase family protein n=1 Tax=Aequorivita sediminis TaxID=3073653 RepID=UPI0028B25E33|nr:polysaccharide pyruvyl transferase family protein [Aequorivita sp. F6058]
MAKKTILVDIYLAHNLGDDLFLDHLSHSFPDLDFVPFHPGKNYTLFFENYKNIKQFPYTIIDKIAARLGKNKLIDYHHLSKKYDGLLFLGGGIFREESYWHELYDYRLKITKAFKNRDKKVFFSGCNFGPFNSPEFLKAHTKLYKKIDKITFRDMASYNFFSKLQTTFYAPDLLWSYKLPKVNKKKNVLGISVIDPRHKEQYKHTYEEYISKHKKICESYLKQGYEIKLFSFCESEGDLDIAIKIAEDFPDMKIFNYNLQISSYLEEIGECNLFIAARFHAVILAFKFEIPVIPVIYGDKTENLLIDLKFRPPFVFLDSITSLSDSDFLSLKDNQINILEHKSEKHFDIEF